MFTDAELQSVRTRYTEVLVEQDISRSDAQDMVFEIVLNGAGEIVYKSAVCGQTLKFSRSDYIITAWELEDGRNYTQNGVWRREKLHSEVPYPTQTYKMVGMWQNDGTLTSDMIQDAWCAIA